MRTRISTTILPSAKPLQEWHLQAAAVTALRRARKQGWPIRIAGDMNAGKRGRTAAGIAAATGLAAGEPDLRIYLPKARVLLIEYKRPKVKGKHAAGKRSPDQIEAHDELTALGHDVITLTPADESAAAAETLAAVAERLGLPIPVWNAEING